TYTNNRARELLLLQAPCFHYHVGSNTSNHAHFMKTGKPPCMPFPRALARNLSIAENLPPGERTAWRGVASERQRERARPRSESARSGYGAEREEEEWQAIAGLSPCKS
ncbi:hypothetical protein KC19_7G144000, partial [Ceratodon purpureus]